MKTEARANRKLVGTGVAIGLVLGFLGAVAFLQNSFEHPKIENEGGFAVLNYDNIAPMVKKYLEEKGWMDAEGNIVMPDAQGRVGD